MSGSLNGDACVLVGVRFHICVHGSEYNYRMDGTSVC